MANYDWSGFSDPGGYTYDTGTNSSSGGWSWSDILGSGTLKDVFSTVGDILGGTSKTFGKTGQVAGIAGLAYLLNNLLGSQKMDTGYKGGIPTYTATRTQTPYSTSLMTDTAGVPLTTEAGATIPRRPGSSAINYFTPITYTKAADGGLMSGYPSEPVLMMNQGGIASLGAYSDGGRLLKGPGDGVSDDIPAVIGERQPARLADGEFVIPARIVSELGNGSTEAGARKLYAMMDRVQKQRSKTVGKNKVAVDSKSDKHLPA